MARTRVKIVNKKAVAIAKDVLKWLGTQYIANSSTYTDATIWKRGRKTAPTDGDLRDHIDKIKSCKVCALGACVLSKARLFDKLPMAEVVFPGGDFGLWGNIAHREVDEVFGEEQRMLIESAFERGNMGNDDRYEEIWMGQCTKRA